MTDSRPIRILHAILPRGGGGLETWLLHVLRHIDRRRFQMDILVPPTNFCDHDEEIRALGSRIIFCPRPRRFWQFARHFRKCLREYGPYDVVHSHLHHFDGFVLRLAAKAGIRGRITHSRFDMRVVDARRPLWRQAYMRLMKHWIARYATVRLAVSNRAGQALFNGGGGKPSWQLNHTSLDLEPFHERVEPTSIRAELGIPEKARVIGHVGRIAEEKNHRFLLEVMAEVARRDPTVYLLLVGDGVLRAEVERDVARRSLPDRVVFAGARLDVPRLMLGAMDVFVFPSHHEGLGRVAVEAQAAGLPCILADTIPSEADLVPSLVRRLPLGEPSTWAGAILEAIAKPGKVSRDEALRIVERSLFNVCKAIESLERVYEEMYAVRVSGA
jgi:glycosyltransferase involved in cell wall biosynthesis